MHASKIVEGFFGSVQAIHRSRIDSYKSVTAALMSGCRLSLCGLAVKLTGPTLKSAVKRVDRLIGSTRVTEESFVLGRRIVEAVVRRREQLWVGIDWSPASPGSKFVELRASVLSEGVGRGRTFYQEVYPLEQLNDPDAEYAFLGTLSLMLPDEVPVILVTDAGFHRTWFCRAEEFGFEWVGRIREGQQIGEAGHFEDTKAWFSRATAKPERVNDAALTKRYRKSCDLVLYRAPPKRRKDYRTPGHGSTHKAAAEARKSAAEPWLLACSPGLRAMPPEQIVAIYRCRMQIEENFRDHKSLPYGFGQELSRSRTAERIRALLLIGTIAAFLL